MTMTASPITRDAPVDKTFRGGTHRMVSPTSTVDRITPLLPALGITRVADVTGLDRIGIPVVVVCRPNSRSLSVSQGKGVDLASAKASGIMESIESWHGERIDAPLRLGTYEDVRYSHRVAHLPTLPRVEASAFHRNLPLLWIEGRDLLSGEPVLLPYELVHTNFTLPLPTGHGCFAPSSNGLASGNHVLEAISHAISEVVERDANTLWNLLDDDAARATRIDLSTIDDDDCRSILALYDAASVDVAVWEMTSDVGIPAFRCVIAERGVDTFQVLHSAAGMGCHPVRTVALSRALTEAAQSRLTVTAGSRDDVLRTDYDRFRSPDLLRRDQALVGDGGAAKPFSDGPSFDGATFDDDVEWMLARLTARGIREVVVVDLTRSDLGIPVVRVVIPGMEVAGVIPGTAYGDRAKALVSKAS